MTRERRTRRGIAGLVAAAATVAIGVAGCGASGPGVTARSRHASPAQAAGPGPQTVRYHGLQFTVPGDWPVHDLTADPTTCVRFDVHAVYLGHPGADMNCPARVLGRTEAVLVEPLDGAATPQVGAMAASQVNDLAIEVDQGAAVEGQVHADVPAAGVTVTVTYANSDADAQQIVDSFEAAR
ncbi:MAG TPA: hypothetical protein VEP49_07785 [Acidimicrobiia bacterium]|nr:hypothetical protein [Acidimicrobiia bacterium]